MNKHSTPVCEYAAFLVIVSYFCIKLELVALFTEKALLCQANWQREYSFYKGTTS